jgi:hypothetical protein
VFDHALARAEIAVLGGLSERPFFRGSKQMALTQLVQVDLGGVSLKFCRKLIDLRLEAALKLLIALFFNDFLLLFLRVPSSLRVVFGRYLTDPLAYRSDGFRNAISSGQCRWCPSRHLLSLTGQSFFDRILLLCA